jgi:arsenite methyltransferase
MQENSQLREGVRGVYSRAAEQPQEKHPFPVGRRFAESVGYPPPLLASLPAVAIDAFAGVSNVGVFAEIPRGSTVLDLGCGSGLDTLVAATRTGPEGRVVSVDFSEPMLARARQAAVQAGLGNIEFLHADAEGLPIPDAAIDVALTNGIFNLNPARDSIFRELSRVVKPGGAFYAAELILIEPLSEEARRDVTNWFA